MLRKTPSLIFSFIGLWLILTWTISVPSAVLAQDAHSQHGAHSAGIAEKSFQADLSVPDEIKKGQTFPIKIHIQDDKGQSIADFDIFQEKLMHLILVRDDLEFFRHLHPEYKGNGFFQTEAMLPSAGTYTFFSDYKPTGQNEQVSVLKLGLKGTEKSPSTPDTKRTEKIIEDIKVSLNSSPKTVRANEEITLLFSLNLVSDNSPVQGLQPYLGEKGHLVIIRKSTGLTTKDYIHAHAMKEGAESEIKFMSRFPQAGLYKLWCQFDRKGTVVTADFWINVEPLRGCLPCGPTTL